MSNNLKEFVTDIANALREKEETTELINPQDFGTRIRNIQTKEDLDAELTEQEGLLEEVESIVENMAERPSGEIEITENGIYDVSNYASANVQTEAKEDLDAELNAQENKLKDLRNQVDELPEKDEINLGETTATAEDVLKGKVFFNSNREKVTGTYKDMLQARVDETNSCRYLFYGYTGYNADFIKDLNTSEVTDMSYMFGNNTYLQSVPLFDTSKVTNFSYMFYSGSGTSLLQQIPHFNTSNGINFSGMFYQHEGIRTIPQLDVSSGINFNDMFYNCTGLKSVPPLNTRNGTDLNDMFRQCTTLETIGGIDLLNATNATYMIYYTPKLKNLTLKNIRRTIEIGREGSYGQLLTLDSLLNTIQELWTNTGTSTITLTMGTTNTAKLADVYVKLIPITDEMRAEDEYIDNKAPFVQCESTDDGAMLITEYVTTIKNWQLA